METPIPVSILRIFSLSHRAVLPKRNMNQLLGRAETYQDPQLGFQSRYPQFCDIQNGKSGVTLFYTKSIIFEIPETTMEWETS